MKNRDRIFLVRHGIAEDSHAGGDEARALTEEGRTAFRKFARDMADELRGENRIIGIVTSPLVRAVQTAEILADAVGITEVRTEMSLAADVATPRSLTALARKLGAGWAFVGHNPSFGNTVATWLGLDPRTVSFRKGGLCAIALSPNGTPPHELVFMAAPGKKTITTVGDLTS
ncbi:MAG TPA: histidine phosphatase family protein [Polyangia bacterium]